MSEAQVSADRLADPTIRSAVAAPSRPPEVTHLHIQLPKTNLHCIRCGGGPPLIIVPATVSKIENWRALVQFMGQRFTVFFFELPGHGESTPFDLPFSSALTAETVEALIDHLGYPRISLMGFSFGGILAMATLQRLKQRVQRVILLSPALSTRALRFTPVRLWLLRQAVAALQRPAVRRSMFRLARNRIFSGFVAAGLRRMGRVEKTIRLHEVFEKVSDTTAEVLARQMNEMLNFELPEAATFTQPCYLAMSVRDPLLDFETTFGVINRHFARVHVERFDFPFHQPPRPFSYEEMTQHYSRLLDVVSQ